MTTSLGMILFIIGFAGGAGVIWFLRQKEIDNIQSNTEQMKDAFGNLSKEALGEVQNTFMELAKNQLESHLKSSDDQLDNKKKLIDSSLKELKDQLENLNKRTGELKGQMEQSQSGISQLADSTSQLRQILSSSQARGQWGERMVEDILNFIGLAEGINYSKQSQSGSDRPDFTFFLPDEKIINMDVKFPLAHYEKFIAADSDIEKESEKKAFLRDVRERVKEVAKRTYINTEGGTVDYVLLFIPNESIYAFLNQEGHDLIDFSLEKKILLCSPITLYAILSLIRQAVSNFAMEQKAGEMQAQVGKFREQWTKFIEKLESLGKTLGTATTHYESLTGPRLRALEKPMDKINELQLGQDKTRKEIEE